MAKSTKATAANPFDAIAIVGKSSSKKSTKPQCPTTPEQRKDVDNLIRINGEIAKLASEQADIQTRLIEIARTQQDADGFAGQFSKSYELAGNEGTVVFTATDRWSEIKADILEGIQKFLGKLFTIFVRKVRTIELSDKATEDTNLLNAIVKAAADCGYAPAEAFTVKDSYWPVKGCDELVYTNLKPAQLPEFRSLISQYKPSVR